MKKNKIIGIRHKKLAISTRKNIISVTTHHLCHFVELMQTREKQVRTWKAKSTDVKPFMYVHEGQKVRT